MRHLILWSLILLTGYTQINHVVVCWYKPQTPQHLITEAMQATRLFAHIPGISLVSAGKPLKSERKSVENSYTFAVHLKADSKAALDAYTSHAIHRRFLEQYVTGKVEKIVIYDF